MSRWYGRFRVKCCGKSRGILHGILICSVCDFNHKGATGIPNEHDIKDLPE